MSSPQDSNLSEEQKINTSEDNTETRCDSHCEEAVAEQLEESSHNESSNDDLHVNRTQGSDTLSKSKITPVRKERCSSGGSDISSAKKKRAPCPWQVHPPPRPFKKARYAWQIKNYEHTVSRMKKAVAQQQQQHHQQAGQTSSSYSRSSVHGSDAMDDPGESNRPGPPGSTHYPGLYSNLQTPYPSNFYSNPLLRWSKLATSSVDSPVNRMLHNLFFSGNEPPPDLHSLLMLSLAEGNAAALTENMNCEDLPSNLPVEALSGALMPQSQLHHQSAIHNSSSNLSSPGMQSPPTSDYDSSSDDASLGDDIVPEPQVMPSHLPPSSYQQHLQQQHVAVGGQHHPPYGPGPQQCQVNCPAGACPLYPQSDCDLQNAIPASRKLFLQHQQNLEQSHLNSPENTNANLMFQNAMMNCPLGMTNRSLFNFQLQSFCERMQANNALLPFPAYQQHFPPNNAHISEYIDSQDEDGDSSAAELPLRRNISPSGDGAQSTHTERADLEDGGVDHSEERADVAVDVLPSQPAADEPVDTGGDGTDSVGVRSESGNSASNNATDDANNEPRTATDGYQSSGAGDRAGEDDVLAANVPRVDAVDDVSPDNTPIIDPVSGGADQDSALKRASKTHSVHDADVSQVNTEIGQLSGAPPLSSVDTLLTGADDHSTSESSGEVTHEDQQASSVTSGDSDNKCDSKDREVLPTADGDLRVRSVEQQSDVDARAESVVRAEARTAAGINAENGLINESLDLSQPGDSVSSSLEKESGSVELPFVVREGDDVGETDKVSSSPVTECSTSGDSSIVAPVSLTVGSSIDIGDNIGSNDATVESISLNVSGQTSEEPALVGSPAIICSSVYCREGNSPKCSLVLKPKIDCNDCDSDSTEETFSPSSFSSNSKCLNCVNGCDNCSNNLRDSTTSTTTETLGSTLCGTTTATPTTRSCTTAGRVTVVTCSCVIAKDRVSDPPMVAARSAAALASTGSHGPPSLPVVRSSSATIATTACNTAETTLSRKEGLPEEQRQPSGDGLLWSRTGAEGPPFASDNNGDELLAFPRHRDHWHVNMEEDEEELVEGEYDEDEAEGAPPAKKRCLECSSFGSAGGIPSDTVSAGDVPLSDSNNVIRCAAGGVRTAELQQVQESAADDVTAASTPPPPLTAPALNEDEDAAAGATTTTTAAAVVHHMCDNNNDKYFLDQAFHLAIKQGLGYQKA